MNLEIIIKLKNQSFINAKTNNYYILLDKNIKFFYYIKYL